MHRKTVAKVLFKTIINNFQLSTDNYQLLNELTAAGLFRSYT